MGIGKELSMLHRIDAVLPLTMKDFERFRILYMSMQHFKCLGRCWVVVPDLEFEKLNSLINDERIRVIPETRLVPEFHFFPKTPGWYKQQLIKLSASEIVDTDFYLTLDADVICVKDIAFSDLVVDGKGMTRRIKEDIHRRWYKWAERVTGLPRSGLTHGVTPALFNKKAMFGLHSYLSKKINIAFQAISKILPRQLLIRNYFGSWKSFLLRNLPWTEYSLYNTYLEATGLFDEYHFDGGEYSIYNNSVWDKESFDSWQPHKSFNGTGNFFFSIVQSNTGISENEILDKIAPYLNSKTGNVKVQNPNDKCQNPNDN